MKEQTQELGHRQAVRGGITWKLLSRSADAYRAGGHPLTISDLSVERLY